MVFLFSSSMKLISDGAEALIYRDGKTVVKDRVKKGYRLPALDAHLRKSRTRRETKVLEKLQAFSWVPRLVESDRTEKIVMSFVKGKRVRDVLTTSNALKFGKEMGTKIRLLHDLGIIHGDLTTSNMLYADEIIFIDFGLSSFSEHVEDKAVDLHLLKQTFESKHHLVAKKCFAAVLKGYDNKAVAMRLEVVESRGKNKGKH